MRARLRAPTDTRTASARKCTLLRACVRRACLEPGGAGALAPARERGRWSESCGTAFHRRRRGAALCDAA
eukprot:6204128-Pleurochrysis_carterae.AAC.4